MNNVLETTLNGFSAEAQVLMETAKQLGGHRLTGDRESFERILRALDIAPAEVEAYWDAFDSTDERRIDLDRIYEARSNTQLAARLGIILDSNKLPRNWLLYRLLQQHFPDILQVRWIGSRHIGGRASKGNPAERRLVLFERSPQQIFKRGKRNLDGAMPVYQVYQGRQPAQFTAHIMRVAEPLMKTMSSEIGLKLAQLIVDCNMLLPSLSTARLLADVLRAGQAGRKIWILGAFCPDYAYEVTGNPHIPYRYTFDAVGEGIGLVAQQFVRIVPAFSRFFAEHTLPHDIVLGIGDFEADSQDVLDRVGLDRPEFLQRCRASLDAFAQHMPAGIPLILEMCDEARGRGRFRTYAKEATKRMLAGDFGCMGQVEEDLPAVLARIPGQYRTFYERWYGRVMSDDDVNRLIFSQGGEYAALARMYVEDFGHNIIILAGDRPEMHRFNAFFQPLTTLCAKRAY